MTSPVPAHDASLEVDAVVRRGTFEVSARFDAHAGETIALVGPNGSGKSTVVSALAGLLPLARGRIGLAGMCLSETGWGVPPEGRPIGTVFQDVLLFPHLTAIENVAFPLRARGVSKKEAHAAAARLLERLDAGGKALARPHTLSGGEAQRVALARALVAEPALLLLDEPLSALDVGARARLRELLRQELARFPGVRVVVTHDPVEAATLADRLVLLEDGRVTQIGTIDEIRTTPRSRYAADLVGVNAFRGRLSRADDRTGMLETDAGSIVVPWPAGLDAGEAIGIVRPSDVTISLERPLGSARNVLRGRITSIAGDGERARLRLATTPTLVAEVTAGSVERLGLREGAHVWASFKAVEVRVVPS